MYTCSTPCAVKLLLIMDSNKDTSQTYLLNIQPSSAMYLIPWNVVLSVKSMRGFFCPELGDGKVSVDCWLFV